MFEALDPSAPFFLFGLFEHEHKQSVLNFVVQRNTEYAEPVKSKDSLVLCVGPRRYRVNPIYSQHVRGGGKGANNVHKSERYLRHGAATVATIYGPIVFGKQPCLLLREDEDDEQAPALVASGSFFNADTTRINAKRILLTGHPVKIHKKTVTVSLMFFNADDGAVPSFSFSLTSEASLLTMCLLALLSLSPLLCPGPARHQVGCRRPHFRAARHARPIQSAL